MNFGAAQQFVRRPPPRSLPQLGPPPASPPISQQLAPSPGAAAQASVAGMFSYRFETAPSEESYDTFRVEPSIAWPHVIERISIDADIADKLLIRAVSAGVESVLPDPVSWMQNPRPASVLALTKLVPRIFYPGMLLSFITQYQAGPPVIAPRGTILASRRLRTEEGRRETFARSPDAAPLQTFRSDPGTRAYDPVKNVGLTEQNVAECKAAFLEDVRRFCLSPRGVNKGDQPILRQQDCLSRQCRVDFSKTIGGPEAKYRESQWRRYEQEHCPEPWRRQMAAQLTEEALRIQCHMVSEHPHHGGVQLHPSRFSKVNELRATGSLGDSDSSLTTYVAVWSMLSTASMAASAYHGYKRNDSVGWALVWGLCGALFPVITPTIALAQGFGKKG